MNRLIFNIEALRHNILRTNKLMARVNSSWTLVSKVLCGDPLILNVLNLLGVSSVGESRLENLEVVKSLFPEMETWYLRIPDPSSVDKVVQLADYSLESEIKVIRQLNKEAAKLNKIHKIVIMIELGDLREGILPGSLVAYYSEVFQLQNVEVVGIGSNLGCLSGTIPSIDQFMQLLLYKELLELKFLTRLPIISAGTTVTLPMVFDRSLPKGINHFRVGEAVFLGTDLINGGLLDGYRDDVVMLEVEIAEIKKKNLIALGETSSNTSPFHENANTDDYSAGQRGYRALISIGELDTDVSGLTPIDDSFSIAGGSSDITVINVGDEKNGLGVGDFIQFKPSYSSLLRLMSGKYIKTTTHPPIDEMINQPSEELSSLGVEDIDTD